MAIQFYLGAGGLVVVAFFLFGIEKVEPYSRGSLGFRPLLVPGICMLWPLVLRRWYILATGREHAS